VEKSDRISYLIKFVHLMRKWFKRNSEEEPKVSEIELENSARPADEPNSMQKPGLLSRFKQGLSKTRHQFGEGVGRLLLGKKEINAELIEELETLLLSADVGIETTETIITQLQDELARKSLSDGDAVYAALKNKLISLLHIDEKTFLNQGKAPLVILMVGVNGAGKTTTIGKLAKQFQQQGKKVLLAAGDTFRAAAVEQLQAWGTKNQIPVIAQHTGADSASVIYDALQSAQAKGVDILIADTAGRLHTQHNLMEELKKIKRVLQKIDPSAPQEILLVLDASIGQNALTQARQFHQAMGVTGLIMTKLDGTAKGGIIFAIANELKIPFRFIGIGEKVDDLRPFDAAQFVNIIFNDHVQSS
jgi:fused signal recognition particle receptor